MRGRIRKRGKQSWEVTYDIGRDATGRRQQRQETVLGLRRDAETRLAEILSSIGKGTYVATTNKTLGQYLDAWLGRRQRELSPTTFASYQTIIKAHLKPKMGHIEIQALRWEHVEGYYDGLREQLDELGNVIEERKLSEQSLLHHHRLLAKALKDAVKKGDLGRNPMDSVTAPSPTRRVVEAFPTKLNASLLDLFQGQWHSMVMLALGTGMRRGEVCGLKWDKVDLDAAQLEVARNLVKTNRLTLKAPKTKGSARRISLPATLVKKLRTHRAAQAEDRLFAGEAYDDQGYVFARPDGAPVHPDAFWRAFKAGVKGERDFAHLDVHALRHCHASQLIAANVNIKTVSARLGHSTIVITLDTYGHLLPGMDEAAARAIDESLSG